MPGAEIARPPVHRITLAQLVVLVPLSLTLAVVDKVSGYSAASGGLIAVIPHAWFAVRAFRSREAQAIARNSYAAEVGKFLLSALGFAVVFATLRPVDGLAVFAGFGAMLAIQITGSWWLLRRSATT